MQHIQATHQSSLVQQDFYVFCDAIQRSIITGVAMSIETTVKLEFDQPVKSVTPGQAAVFYKDDVCLGGGTIEKVYKDGKEIEYL